MSDILYQTTAEGVGECIQCWEPLGVSACYVVEDDGAMIHEICLEDWKSSRLEVFMEGVEQEIGKTLTEQERLIWASLVRHKEENDAI